jgi:hypothetical protein
MRTERPVKEMRRASVNIGETDENNRVPGADGDSHGGRRRPGRAASLLSSSANLRSQRWRTPKKGKRTMRRGVLAKGSRTGRNRTK